MLQPSQSPRFALLLLSLSLATPLSAFASSAVDDGPSTTTVAPAPLPDPDCPSCALSRASNALSQAASTVVEGSLTTVGASGMLVVTSVEVLAQGSVVVLKGVSDGVSVTVQLSGQAIQGLGLASGAIVQASAVATGHILISAGKVIAFIPNELGKALIHHEKVQ